MRIGSRRFLCLPLALCAVSCALYFPRPLLAQPNANGLATNPPPVANEGEAWGTFDKFKEKMGDLPKTDPAAAIEAMRGFFNANPKLHPVVSAVLSADIANLYREKLNKPDKALEIYDWGLNTGYKDLPSAMMMVEGKAHTLVATNRAQDALDLLTEQWPQMVEAGRGGHPYLRGVVARSLYWRVQALQKLNKNDEIVSLLKQSLTETPVLLAPQNQLDANWNGGWIYAKLVDTLVAKKQYDEALRWAKLSYAEADFSKEAIEKASELPGKVWGAQGDFVAARGFGLAQEDPKRKNPLSEVKLPELDTAEIETELKALQDAQKKGYDTERAPQIVTLQIALGDLRGAMEEARYLLVKRPTAPEGVQQIARVFKAADMNLARANQFVAYLDGKGEDPLPAFMEADKPAAAPDKAVTTP